jgi:hypothetical protein
LNEAELEVDSEKASYKQKLEVLQQQEELIEDEEEQEQKEEDARRAKKEADEQEARTAQSLLPDSEVASMFTLHAHWMLIKDHSCNPKKLKLRMLG